MRHIEVSNNSRQLKLPLTVAYCDSFWCKLRGLALRRQLAPSGGLLLAEPRQSRLNAGIHMLGMAFDLCVVWLDKDLKIVDLRHAKRWRSVIFPRKPARYVIELHVSRLGELRIGDQLAFKERPAI
ncbi:MAG: DUF192 domain-containing protein [Anaerolineales bacterium]